MSQLSWLLPFFSLRMTGLNSRKFRVEFLVKKCGILVGFYVNSWIFFPEIYHSIAPYLYVIRE